MTRSGMTLIELLVVLALIGLAGSIVGLSLERWQSAQSVDPLASAISTLRREAIDSARATTRIVVIDSASQLVTALPDGSVLFKGEAIDRFTGKPTLREK